MQCYNIVIKLHLTILPVKYLLLWLFRLKNSYMFNFFFFLRDIAFFLSELCSRHAVGSFPSLTVSKWHPVEDMVVEIKRESNLEFEV
jgi:hypothetical protein